MSIDEMIAQGKTLPEIQAALRQIVAARDEQDLKVAQRKKARDAFLTASFTYLDTLGSPLDKAMQVEVEKELINLEKELLALQNQCSGKKMKSPVVTVAVEQKADNDEESLGKWLKEFIATL